MAKRTLRKPKKSKRTLAKKIQRKTRSKRLRSRGRRMSDKALSRSRLKQKKSKRRGKILRGGVKVKQTPKKLPIGSARVPPSQAVLKAARDQSKAAAAARGRRKVQSKRAQIAAQSGSEQIAQAAAFALLKHKELQRRHLLQKAERAATAQNFGAHLAEQDRHGQAREAEVAAEMEEIQDTFDESDRSEEGAFAGELPRMLRDGQRLLVAPAARAAASAINDPRAALYYAADQLVQAGDGYLGEAGPTNMAVSAAAAVRAGQMAAAAGQQMAHEAFTTGAAAGQRAFTRSAEGLRGIQQGLVESLKRASSDMGSGDFESFAGQHINQQMQGE